MTRLLCTADWQLGAHGRLDDQRDVVLRIADVAIEEAVDGILLGGDLLEGPAMQPEQLEVVTAFIDRLQGRIPCLGITGNGRHDLATRTRNGLEIFNHVDGIEIHSTPATVEFAGAAVGLLPWVHPGRLIAQAGGETSRDEINAIASSLLIDIAGDLYAAARGKGLPTLLLGHWHCDEALDANGNGIAQFVKEPLLSFSDLLSVGWDVVALAHNHRGQQLGGNGFHIGSPMPLDFGEIGWEHGVWIVDFDPTIGFARTFHRIESRRLVRFDEQLDAHDREGLTLAFTGCDVDEAIVRVVLHGASSDYWIADVPAIKRALYESGAHRVEIRPDLVRVDRARVEGIDEQLDELQSLDLYIEANGIDPELADWMRATTARILEEPAVAR